jgi:hypothetical protein
VRWRLCESIDERHDERERANRGVREIGLRPVEVHTHQ